MFGFRNVCVPVVVLLFLGSCASNNSRWEINSACFDQSPKVNSRYQVSIDQVGSRSAEDKKNIQYLQVQAWKNSRLEFVGVNPLGIVLFNGEFTDGDINIRINPLYRDYDFSLVLQSSLAVEQHDSCKHRFFKNLSNVKNIENGVSYYIKNKSHKVRLVKVESQTLQE